MEDNFNNNEILEAVEYILNNNNNKKFFAENKKKKIEDLRLPKDVDFIISEAEDYLKK